MSKYKVGDKFLVELVIDDYDSHLETYWVTDKRGREDFGYWFDEYEIDRMNVASMEQKSYEKGLQDAWVVLKKTDEMSDEEYVECFGGNVSLEGLTSLTPQEALAKLEAYEKEQEEIKVGDVVQAYNAREYVVIATSEEMPNNQPLLRNLYDNSVCFGTNEDLKKTGKHIDIQGLLSQIGEWE